MSAQALDLTESCDAKDFTAKEVHFKFESQLQKTVAIGAIVFGLMAFFSILREESDWRYFIPLCCVLSIFYKFIHSGLILDNSGEKLVFERTILGVRAKYALCSFEDMVSIYVKEINTSSRGVKSVGYDLFIVCEKGPEIALTNNKALKAEVLEANGKALAEHIGIPFSSP